MNIVGTATHGSGKHDTTVSICTAGTYVGDGSADKAIAHGLPGVPKSVLIYSDQGEAFAYFNQAGTILGILHTPSTVYTVAAFTGTNFYVGDAASLANSANVNLRNYNWVAWW